MLESVGNKSGRIVIGGPNNQSINLAGTLDASSRHQIQAQNKNSVVAISWWRYKTQRKYLCEKS